MYIHLYYTHTCIKHIREVVPPQLRVIASRPASLGGRPVRERFHARSPY